jgi:hypothetical protein
VDTNEAEEKSDKKAKWTPSIGVLECAGLLVGGLIVLLFVSSIIGTPDTPLLARFSAIDRWAGFFANLVVVFYVFPTFKLTKDRAFLYLGFPASFIAAIKKSGRKSSKGALLGSARTSRDSYLDDSNRLVLFEQSQMVLEHFGIVGRDSFRG